MTYLIGEIGQNHNGSVDIARLLISIAARPVIDKYFGERLKPFNAVKMTKRDLREELSDSEMKRPYGGPHSFGKTYGEHRARLELTDEQHHELYVHAKFLNLDFIETLCSRGTLRLLRLFMPDRLKVASRDLTNLPLLEAMAETRIPIVLSTGMAGQKDLDEALGVITRYHDDIAILHCVSEYPTQYKNVNLRTIPYLKARYPKYRIGFSDHTIGISTPIAAAAMGAEIIEKHITVDRKMKGADQAGSLGIDGMERLVRDIRNLELSLGVEDIFVCKDVYVNKAKLERSIATVQTLEPGHRISIEDIHLLSPGTGLRWSEKDRILGRKVRSRIPANEIIHLKWIEDGLSQDSIK